MFYKTGGAGGIWEALFKNRMTHHPLSNFSTCLAALRAVIFSDYPPPTSRYCAHYGDNHHNPSITELLVKNHKSKERELKFRSPI